MHEEFLSDYDRKKELGIQGYNLGKASGLGSNCLIDSLLQLLLHHKVVNGPPSTKISAGRWSRDLCERTRSHLCQHENVVLHPRIRDETYKEKKKLQRKNTRVLFWSTISTRNQY